MTRESIRTFIVNNFYVCDFATLRIRHAHVFVKSLHDCSDTYYERYNGLLYDHHITCYPMFISYFLLKVLDRVEKTRVSCNSTNPNKETFSETSSASLAEPSRAEPSRDERMQEKSLVNLANTVLGSFDVSRVKVTFIVLAEHANLGEARAASFGQVHC